MNRRSFLFSSIAAAFTGIVARLKPKSDLSGWTVNIETGPSYEILPRALKPFCELPEPITELRVFGEYLFAFTATGVYEVFGDGSYEKIDVASHWSSV